MITVLYADREESLPQLDEGALNRYVASVREEGREPCIKVRITTDEINLLLPTAGCPPGRGGGQANAKEQSVIDSWREMGLTAAGFPSGHLIAFLKRLRNMGAG